jgi:hypothetical protein
MKKLLLIVFILIIVYFVYSLLEKDSYVGFFYPDASNLIIDVMSEEKFDSLWECRVWAEGMALDYAEEIIEHGNKYDYECGLNCDLSGSKPYRCAETLQ